MFATGLGPWLMVFIGGGLGSICRYGLARWIPWSGNGFPWATLAANGLSCIVLSIAFIYFAKDQQGIAPWKLLIMTGYCGGFSTFSTFGLETFTLLESQQYIPAILYVFSSLILALLIFGLIIRFTP